jgi:hypothetical protein
VAGTFQSAQGSFTWNGASYGVPSGTAFGHTGPVTLTPSATADAVKAAIWSNPGSLAGTLAEGWIAGHNWVYQGGQWLKRTPALGDSYWYAVGVGGAGVPLTCSSSVTSTCTAEEAAIAGSVGQGTTYTTAEIIGAGCYLWSHYAQCEVRRWNNTYTRWETPTVNIYRTTPSPGEYTPVDSDDLAALPDPLPTVSPELPYAPYLPAGVPVNQNNFQILDLGTNTTHNCTNGGCD